MKKAIVILIAGLLLSGNAYAEIKLIESATIKNNPLKALIGGNFSINTICVDGYKFVVSKGGGKASSRAMVQFFEERDGKSLPAKC